MKLKEFLNEEKLPGYVLLFKNKGFNINDIGNRRFMFNPKTNELILGKEWKYLKKKFSSHAEEHFDSGTKSNYDDFSVKGWIGSSPKNGIVHFAPQILKKDLKNPQVADNFFKTIEFFIKHKIIKPDTIILNGIKSGEHKAKELFPEFFK